ncbi:MAG: metallophosphoesterase [Clostridia bacterium]|nr:metallophosphoesterase [Clostridia bacterium]
MSRRYHDSLFSTARQRGVCFGFFFIIILILFALLMVYNLFLNTHPILLRQSVTVNDLPSSLEGFKILHISDLGDKQFGSMQEQLLSLIEKETYHAVCITGDITDKGGHPKALVRLLSGMKKNIPVFFIAGDEDPQPLAQNPEDDAFTLSTYIQTLQQAGAVYLDAPVAVEHNGGTVWFAPENLYTLDVESSKAAAEKRVTELLSIDRTETEQLHLQSSLYTLDRFRRLEEAQKTMDNRDIYIALTHVPLSYTAMRNLHDSYSDGQSIYIDGVSLVLAGHYNAGQWRVPSRGALYVPQTLSLQSAGFFPDDKGLVGIQSMMGITQYISPGLNTSRIYPFPLSLGRFLNRPAITLITLTSKLTAY